MDSTEDRRNSFSLADEQALAQLSKQLTITVHLVPEDPRYADLQTSILSKLERIIPRIIIRPAGDQQSAVGSASDESYGEVEYSYGGRSAVSRSTGTEEILPLLYGLANVPLLAPVTGTDDYPGYPLVAAPWIALPWFLGGLPLLIGVAWWRCRRVPPSNTLQARRRSAVKISNSLVTVAVAAGLVALLLPASAGQRSIVNFSDEEVGADSKAMPGVVGIWRIETEGDNKVLAVDGRQWKEGQTSAGLADKARALYGERYAEFLDRVQAYAYFPYAVFERTPDFRDGEISVRFEGISGRIDQGAGILFNLKPNGDYLTIRANPLENNLVLWRFERGKRSSVTWVKNTPTSTHEWHDLKLRIAGTKSKAVSTASSLPAGHAA